MTYLICALIVVGIILLTVGIHSDKTASFDDGSFLLELGAIVTGIVCLLMAGALGVVLLLTPAAAHDHARPDLNSWFDSLRSGNGPCCSNADGTALADIDWETKDGHYRVRIEDQWWDVPDEAVITEPNLAQRTMVWPMYKRWPGGMSIDIRCFMPGSLT